MKHIKLPFGFDGDNMKSKISRFIYTIFFAGIKPEIICRSRNRINDLELLKQRLHLPL